LSPQRQLEGSGTEQKGVLYGSQGFTPITDLRLSSRTLRSIGGEAAAHCAVLQRPQTLRPGNRPFCVEALVDNSACCKSTFCLFW
jgi:hypothetical protein